MTVRDYFGVKGLLAGSAAADSVLLSVSSELSGALVAGGFVNNTDETFLALSTGNIYELVKVTAVNGTVLTVVRGQENTVARPFPVGTPVFFVLCASSIIDRISIVVAPTVLTGTDAVSVENPSANHFIIHAPKTALVGKNGIDVLGEFPNFQIVFNGDESECCGEGGTSTGDGIDTILGEGLVIAFVNGSVATIKVQPPVFESGPNISVTGAWPNYTISATAGSGTVSSVNGGAGIQITGSPSVNPTVAIAATGVVAGTYGGVAVNAQGQITAVPVGFNPVSAVTASNGVGAVRTGASIAITGINAAVGVKGVVALADPDDDFDPTNETQAASPAVVAKAIETLVLPVATGINSYAGESDASYTNIITASNIPIILLAGESAIVLADVTMLDGTTPTAAVPFGMAVFDGTGAKVKSNRLVSQCNQSMQFIVNGPLNTSLTITTTAVPASATVQSYSLSLLKL